MSKPNYKSRKKIHYQCKTCGHRTLKPKGFFSSLFSSDKFELHCCKFKGVVKDNYGCDAHAVPMIGIRER